MGKQTIPKGQATKIKSAVKKVKAYRADHVGLLRQSFDLVGSLVKLLAGAYVEADRPTASEIQLLLGMLQRFRKKVLLNQQALTAALTQAQDQVESLERLLTEAQGEGYALERLTQEATRDMAVAKQLRENLRQRVQEAAFVLADLEQAADPLPGLRIATARVRQENEKRRKSQKTGQVEVELKPDALTSTSIDRSETP